MMLDVLESLKNDGETEIILLLSKKPSQSVANKVITAAENCSKPVVICFMGSNESMTNRKNIFFVGKRCNSSCILGEYGFGNFKQLYFTFLILVYYHFS